MASVIRPSYIFGRISAFRTDTGSKKDRIIQYNIHKLKMNNFVTLLHVGDVTQYNSTIQRILSKAMNID